MKETSVAIPGDHVNITMDPVTENFWLAAKEGRLTAAQCGDCGIFRMPPSPYCPACRSKAVQWPELPGTGTIFSFAICRRSPIQGVPDFTYVPVIVDIDGAPGVRLVTNLVGVEPDKVAIGMRVQVDFSPINGGWMLPIVREA